MSSQGAIPIIDLFAGPGGLGEGFSSFRPRSGRGFRIVLSVEKDGAARSTLRLRAFFRQFSRARVPGLYYDVLRGRASASELFDRFPAEAERAEEEAWHAELGADNWRLVTSRIGKALPREQPWVLIGGPPCQAYSLAGRSRNRGVKGYRPDRDDRQTLYEEYLRVIGHHWPSIFVMENVKGLLSARLGGDVLFERILRDLSDPGAALDDVPLTRRHRYNIIAVGSQASTPFQTLVTDFVVRSEELGIPQARHRVILLGVRSDLEAAVDALQPASHRVPVRDVLERLPRVRSGLSRSIDSAAAWLDTLQGVRRQSWLRRQTMGSDVSDFIASTLDSLTAPRLDRGKEFIGGDFAPAYRPDWFGDGRLEGISNHSTRGHLASDLHRYLFAAAFADRRGRSPQLGEFPRELLPAHRNVNLAVDGRGYFADRFRVQLKGRPSTTVTSHISKDGHAFIHYDPGQCRSLTVREAARLQTFPDNYFFCGPRTEQYQQVGNAVPPLLANGIAGVVWGLLSANGMAGQR